MSQGLTLIHSNRPEVLRDFLVSWLRRHPHTSLEDETILVQSNGVAQWLKLALAQSPDNEGTGGLGIAACLDLSLPSRFVWQAYRTVLGPEAVPDASPFDKDRLVWRLMRLLAGLPAQSHYLPLLRFMGASGDPMRRYQLAQQIADLFDQYQVYRADWLNAWAQGHDLLIMADRTTLPVEPSVCWQPALWRALAHDVGPAGQTSRATVHQSFLERVYGSRERLAGLPSRLFVFGISALPRQSLEVLQAIAKCSQVFVCVHNPCSVDWSDPAHPLLAAWGKQGRDYMGLLSATEEPRAHPRFGEPSQRVDLFEGPGEDCLLHQLQGGILLGLPSAELTSRPKIVCPQTDQSVVFHQTHSAQREIEVLHDQLLHAFDQDASLQPRDIVVMVPDINAYAPIIEAVFGQFGPDDTRGIPFSITDRVLSQQLPMARALDFLLSLDQARCTVSEVVDLLGVPAVRQRIGLSEEQLPLLTRWIHGANIRWAIDADHRGASAGHQVEQNTWIFGLERMLLGYAVGNSLAAPALWQDIAPYPDVSGLDASCVGALTSLVVALRRHRERFSEVAAPQAWVARLESLLSDFFAPHAAQDKAFVLQVQTALLAWQQDCIQADFNAEIPVAVVRSEWQARIEQQQFSQRFFAGRVSFATLMPMRAIPFRMVCLLGLNDGDFPRSRPRADFDLMRHDLRAGDRSRRDDDRYLFLEAILSARDRLYVSWVGKSPVDNADREASVLVSQLRDHIDAVWSLEPDVGVTHVKVSTALTQTHRLQPFHPVYFGSLQGSCAERWFTYAREWQRTAPQSAGSERAVRPADWSRSVLASPQLDDGNFQRSVRLAQLAAVLKDPVATFFKERLRVVFEQRPLAEDDDEPFEVVGLDHFRLQEALIEARYRAVDTQQDAEAVMASAVGQMRAAGELPVGASADVWLAESLCVIAEMFARFEQSRAQYQAPLHDPSFSIGLHTPQGTLLLVDRLQRCFQGQREGRRFVVTARRLHKNGSPAWDKLLGFWVEHLALQIAGPREFGFCLGTEIMGPEGDIYFPPMTSEAAQELLTVIGATYAQALCRPLPVAVKTAMAWLGSVSSASAGAEPQGQAHTTNDSLKRARQAYEGQSFGDTPSLGEVGYSPYLMRAFPTLDALIESTEFFALSRALYEPLRNVALEKVVRGQGALGAGAS